MSHISLPSATRPRPSVRYEQIKRGLDVFVALLALVLLAPLWLVIALMIKLSSSGPVLYKATVIGRDGHAFTYYKFRTMYANGDDSQHRRFLEGLVRDGKPHTVVDGRAIYKLVDDPRVTLVGRLLRRFSLDEIPQLINVLRGDMSIVGPRPPVPYEFALYSEYDKQRLAVLPGITGLYQATCRSAVGFRQMVELDLIYIRRRSFVMDIWIMGKTILIMMLGIGAG